MRKDPLCNDGCFLGTRSGNKKSWVFIFQFCFFILSIFFPTNAFSGNTDGLDLNYMITIEDPSNHQLHVKLEIRNIVADTLKLTRQTPYETNPTIYALAVRDDNVSPVSYQPDYSINGFESIIINTSANKTVVVEYTVDLKYLSQDPQGGNSYWNLDVSYGAVEFQLAFFQPATTSEIGACRVYTNLPSNWSMVSRLMNKGDYYETNIDDFVTANVYPESYKFIMWGPVVFGIFTEYLRTIGGVEVGVAFWGNEKLQKEISENLFSIIQSFSENIGALNNPLNSSNPIKYLFVFLYETTRNVHCGDHIYGQFTVLNDEFDFTAMYRGWAHMIAHTWFSHFDLLSKVVHVDTWIEEGIIQFSAVKSLQATDIWSSSAVNEHVIGWYNDYEKYIVGTVYDVPILPESNWFDFPNDRLDSLYTYGIRNIFWYEKIPLVFWLLDNKIEEITSGKDGLYDVWKYLHENFPGTMTKPISSSELLSICNYLTGKDFNSFFSAYIFGNDRLPFYSEDGFLRIDGSQLPKIATLTNLDYVKLRMIWGDQGGDSDSDGLSDELERTIKTNPTVADTDSDGLNDREEYGVIIDGKASEYGHDQPLIQDPQGDSDSTEKGTDIRDVYSGVFINENGSSYLYLMLSTWDGQYNQEILYEFHLTVPGDSYQYRFEKGISYLWHEEDGSYVDIANQNVVARSKDFLEVKIPLDLIGIPTSISIKGITRAANKAAPVDVDWTSNESVSLQPRKFVTDPLNPDSDGDGASDGYEIRSGSNPTNTASYFAGGYVGSGVNCADKEPCYNSIQNAINNAETGSVILIAEGNYSESLTLDGIKSLTLRGGWDSSFSSQTSNTTFIKAPKALQGSLRLQMVTIRP